MFSDAAGPDIYRPWRTNVSLVFSIRRMLLESSAAAPSNETRIAQAPVAERPVALPPAGDGAANVDHDIRLNFRHSNYLQRGIVYVAH